MLTATKKHIKIKHIFKGCFFLQIVFFIVTYSSLKQFYWGCTWITGGAFITGDFYPVDITIFGCCCDEVSFLYSSLFESSKWSNQIWTTENYCYLLSVSSAHFNFTLFTACWVNSEIIFHQLELYFML